MLRSFVRTARRHPGFAATVVGLLGLGIGAGTVVFSTVDALVLDPFPFPQAERLVVVGTEMPHVAMPLGFFERLSGPELVELTERSQTLRAPLPFDLNSVRLRGPEFPLRLFAAFCWANPFPTFDVEPILGRGFLAEELRTGAPVAIFSHQLWIQKFHGDLQILGQVVHLDGVPHTVVGVMPPRTSIYGVEIWLPSTEEATALPRDRRQFNLLARIAEGTDLQAVNAELATLAGALEKEHGTAHPDYRDWRLEAMTWNHWNAFTYHQEARLCLGAVLFVLLLVCANLANLLLSRVLGRRREAAVRTALGAGRRHLLRLVLVESAGYALVGGALGLLLAHLGIRLVTTFLPTTLQPTGKAITLDARAFAFALAATVVTALLVGILPALRLARADLRSALSQHAGHTSTDRRSRRLERLLVAAQVALAVMLLCGAGLLVGGLLRNLHAPLGFASEGLISMRLTLPRTAYETTEIPPFFDHLMEEVMALPGTEAVSVATQVAPSTYFGGNLYLPEGEERGESPPRILHTAVGDDYFRTMTIPLLRGRPLDDRDRSDSPPVLVINELAAQRFFPGRDPLGQRVRVAGATWDTREAEIVGVVATVSNVGPTQPPAPEVFSHHRQAKGRYNQMFLVVRSRTDPYGLLPNIRRVVSKLDPDQPVYAVSTAEEAVGDQLAPRRVAASVLGGFSSLALLLAALGIYGTVAFSVTRRRGEMGLRMALGATRREVMELVVREALTPVTAGLLCGILGSWALARGLASSFEPAAELNVQSLVLPAVALVTAALLASAGPAQRAGQVSPAESLREL